MSDLGVVFIDVETQFLDSEVGGFENAHMMLPSVVCAYISGSRSYKWYMGEDSNRPNPPNHMQELAMDLEAANLIVGFNTVDFDYRVLEPHLEKYGCDLFGLPTFDLKREFDKLLGAKHTHSLDTLAGLNLHILKHKVDAVELYRQGHYHRLIDYCMRDVLITRLLFERAYNYGSLFRRSGKRNRPAEIDTTSWRHEINRRNRGKTLIIS